MSKLTYKEWEWPENPETFHIHSETAPVYGVGADGSTVYLGMSPVCRSFRGTGVFWGTDAQAQFRKLMSLMKEKTAGELVHPEWGTFYVCLTEAAMEEDSRENCVFYSFTFREANEAGEVPVLPGYVWMGQNVVTPGAL